MTGINISGVAPAPTPPATIQALHAVTTTGANSIYAQVLVSTSDLWVRCHAKFLSDLPTGTDFGSLPVAVADAFGLASASGWGVYADSGSDFLFSQHATNIPFASVTTDVWYLVDLHFATGSPRTEELWVDDVDQNATNSSNTADAATAVSFGIAFPGGWETNYGLYLANLKIGTSRGASDIWTTTLTDLSDFDSTVNPDGTLEVVSVTGP